MSILVKNIAFFNFSLKNFNTKKKINKNNNKKKDLKVFKGDKEVLEFVQHSIGQLVKRPQ